MLKKIISSDVSKIFVVFLVLHLLILNVNVAEWGDSYRILRAAEYIRDFDYPQDEKRPPSYSLILALRPENADQVLWSRIIMFGISVATFFVFKKLLDQYKLNTKQQTLALLLFTLNPVYLYWSIRIMADVPFTLLVLLAFMFLNYYRETSKTVYLALTGFVVGLSVLTRFEGYILGLALGFELKPLNGGRSKRLLVYGLASVLTILPWFLFRNPLTSSYFEEPSGRAFDLTTIWIYVTSLLFVFGFTSAFFFLVKSWKELVKFLQLNIGLSFFLVIELILALVWPAAIPRLFTPVIPFLIILLSTSVLKYFEEKRQELIVLFVNLGILGFFTVSQFYLKLQFLVLIKWVLIVILAIQLLNIYAIFIKNYKMFLITLVISISIWSFVTIYIHKDIFRVVQEANLYIMDNIKGSVAFNDVSSVSDWHLNQKSKNDLVEGFYLNLDDKKGRSLEVLQKKHPDYLLITNEHNPTLEFDASEVDYLEPVKEFRYTIRGTEFFTKIVKISYDN